MLDGSEIVTHIPIILGELLAVGYGWREIGISAPDYRKPLKNGVLWNDETKNLLRPPTVETQGWPFGSPEPVSRRFSPLASQWTEADASAPGARPF